jgi:hypothetical protein
MSTPALNPLVEKIRGKYPGAYDDMDDAALTKAVLAKYPQYSDLAAPPVAKPSVKMDTGEGPIAAGMTSFESQIANVPNAAGAFLKSAAHGFPEDTAEHAKVLAGQQSASSELGHALQKVNPIVSNSEGVDYGATAANVLPLVLAAKGARLPEASPTARAALSAAPDAVSAAVKKLPVSVIRNVPWIGDVLHDMYQAGAEAYRKAQPPLDKGAPLPAAPAQELLQANSLLRGPKPVVDPAAGLGDIPVKPGAAGSMAESVAKPPVKPAVVEQQLKQALGAQDLKPGVPLKDQLRGANAQPKPQLPEGFTPVESTAMKGFKYDPATREFETITQGGQRYVHGDVSPEDAQAFMDAESKGKAWQQIRENPLVAKVINGKRIATKPTASAEAAPTDDLMPKLQESLKQAQAAKATAAPKFVYRARDVGESGVPVNNDLAQATSDPFQALKYAEAGQRGAKAGEVVKIDLSKLKPSDYVVKTHPSGAKWIQFTRPLTEDEVSAFTGKTASKK